jgi:superfamily II DNA or RNA helicase
VATTAKTKRIPNRKVKPKLVPRTHKPADMTVEQWQIALRRQFGRDQKFKMESVDGDGEVFADYLVTNPESGHTYRVGIRGGDVGENHCTCPDFAVNTLGTCKHVEFVLGKLERKPGGRKRLAEGYRPPFTEVILKYGSDRRVIVRPGTEVDAGAWRGVGRFLDKDQSLKPEAFDRFDELVEQLRKDDHEVRCHEDAVAFVAQVRDNHRLGERVDAMFPKGADDPAWDGFLKVNLYPYQRTGALFAARAGRSLLADDMGLGKTIQSIAAAEILAAAAGVERVLVVAPTSLKHQWKREIATFTGRSAVVVEGSPEARRRLFESAEGFFKITNYETVHLDTAAIAAWGPDLIILDEAQRIKNWKTRTAQTIKALQSQHAIVLSGTPLENRLEELHSIVAFVDRYRLGPMFRFLAEHQQLDADGRVVGYKNLTSITRTLGPIVLRRTKDQVLKELPGRIEKHFFLPMTPEQKGLHDDNGQVVARLVHRWRKVKFLTEADQRRLTCALQNMRMSCNSTYLLDAETDFGTKADEIIERLEELLETEGVKVVIFSQWVRSHELLIRRLNRRKRKFAFLHGGIPGPKRQALIDRFRTDDACRVFLSTDAGGVGLNLQNASAVFNMDQPWNPAVLEQRIGRVHRLGQTRPVQVMHFVAKDTIEHGMLDLIKFKRSLFGGVLDGDRDDVFMGGTRLKKFMDGVEAATSAIPTGDAAAAPPAPVPAPAPSPVEVVAVATEVVPSAAEAVPAVAVRPVEHPIVPLVETLVGLGQTFLRSLTPAAGNGDAPAAAARSAFGVETDAATGQPYLKLPVPSAEVIAQAGQFLAALAARFGGKANP